MDRAMVDLVGIVLGFVLTLMIYSYLLEVTSNKL